MAATIMKSPGVGGANIGLPIIPPVQVPVLAKIDMNVNLRLRFNSAQLNQDSSDIAEGFKKRGEKGPFLKVGK